MERAVDFSFRGRCFTAGDLQTADQVWFVLHGYGQLAKYFIRKFAPLLEKRVFIVAPEALSHFYLQDVTSRANSGDTRVGASWMTRENRLADIQNYLAYLNALYDQVTPGAEITVLGFSQGAATASRWVLDGHVSFRRLILWSGILPPDIDFSLGADVLKNKETIVVLGRNDPFINDSRFAELNLLAEKLGIKPAMIQFDGGHDIDAPTLLSLA